MLDNWHFIAAVAFVSSSMLGCTGLIETEDPSGTQSPGVGSGNQGTGSGTANGNGSGTTDPQTGAVREKPTQFALPANFPVLLPFEVRMARLSSVVGLDYSHPAFELMRKNATQLGDYDFANGLEPDNTWTALKISLWMQALKPICASPEMRVLYPSLPESLFGTELWQMLEENSCRKVFNVIHLIYQARAFQTHFKDYEFSLETMREHWRAGYDDTRASLAQPDFLARPRGEHGVATHDIHRVTPSVSEG